MLFAAQSAVLGAFCFSYFNDSLFWVVNRMMGIVDVRQQMMIWSVPTTIAWGIGGVSIALTNLIFGIGGTLIDPLLPLIVLGIIFFIVRKS
jgi:H+/gluconate symporter-like permease